MARPSKYDNMTKEEILAEMRMKQKRNAYRAAITLSVEEGEILKNDFLERYDCANPSQFLKKIVKGELIVSLPCKN